MIISHKYRFIFIHCRKVAGSSIKTTLWPHLGEDDIVVGSIDEVLKNGFRLNRATKRALLDPRSLNVSRKALFEYVRHGNSPRFRNHVSTAVKYKYRKSLYHNPVHSPAINVKEAFPDEWKNYFKFCIVRNSYDQALSEFSYQTRKADGDVSFKHFLKALNGEVHDPLIVPSGLKDNWDLYTIDDKVAVERIGHYENLEEDFAEICRELGVPVTEPLRKEKVGARKKDRQLYEWYDDENVRLVKNIYGKEIDYFNYPDPSRNS
ncbi:sulfotransferase family 2 domain-containing protein [Halomonas sp. HP20-15]|uniref:sulfotransferase family 2 domain-containing protein n=1 Tax=Halomonas sp. HP20-15 TaxID=3085901 RepID=UPI0029814C65|nr:sulfotransferase family 2 domain-containing protein [Halomonas sp. HP20-15]MDW5378871.1 sulfotransferase family 2 domain-containing protein [Halomonas sp. HP20-15]